MLSTKLPRVAHRLPVHYRFPARRASTWIKDDQVHLPVRKAPRNTMLLFVPQQSAYVVERLGRFSRVLEPGINLLFPSPIEKIAYFHTLKEQTIPIGSQSAITKDNVTISIDGVLYVRITDAKKASYGVEDPIFAVMQMAQTTMRSELGKITLDKTFEERENLNLNIVKALNSASADWGVECLRYEIRDISPPQSVKEAMNMQATAERQKRAKVTQSEGEQRANVNVADGHKSATILDAQGEAASIRAKATATADGIRHLAAAISGQSGHNAVSLRIAEQYVDAFSKLAKESTTIMLPSNAADPASFVATSLGIYDKLLKRSPAQQQNSESPDTGSSPVAQTDDSVSTVDKLVDDLSGKLEDHPELRDELSSVLKFDPSEDEPFVGKKES